MSAITEQSAFDPVVYQYDTTDPVSGGTGGVANKPIQGLTNRTRWLKDRLAADEATLATLAPINSPAFTGSPTAPTPSTAAAGTEISTASLVRSLAGGMLQITVSGNYQLSQVEAGHANFALVGTTSAPFYLLFPDALAGRWTVLNYTNNPVTVRLAHGGGSVVVTNGYAQTLFSSGADCFPANSNFIDTNLQGAPITPTAPVGDNSSRVANTNFITGALNIEAAARIAGDQSIRNDLGGALSGETAARIAADNQIRADVAAGYIPRGLASGGNAHVNFTPGDNFDVPVSLTVRAGGLGGWVLFTSSVCMTYQVPNPATLRQLVNGAAINSETTYQTMAEQYAFIINPNQTVTLEAHLLTSSGGGWCQMALGASFLFVPSA